MIKKIYLLISLAFLPQFLGANLQYKPLFSPERHEFSSGWAFSMRNTKQDGYFIKYAFLLPEGLNIFSPFLSKNFFVPGLSFGANSFPIYKSKQFEKMCGKDMEFFLPLSLGIKANLPYYELVKPFGEIGLTHSMCYIKNFSKIDKSQKKLKYYLSYGLLLSLKILDKSNIYSLDQDYGLNDIAFRAECLHYYYPEIEKAKNLHFCQFGLQVSF